MTAIDPPSPGVLELAQMAERAGPLRSNHGGIFEVDINQIRDAAFYSHEKRRKMAHNAQGGMPMNTPPTHYSQTRKLLATVAVAIPAMLIGSGLSAPPAQAGYIMTLEQVGSNVVATGSGTIDLADLTGPFETVGFGFMVPSTATILMGPIFPLEQVHDNYTGLTGPTNFGSGGTTAATTIVGGGGFVGINRATLLAVPFGYVSNNPLLSNMETWDDASFSSLGVTPGIYTWTWGTEVHADSFTLQAVPAPLIGRGLPVLLAVGGLLFGAKLRERGKGRRLQFG